MRRDLRDGQGQHRVTDGVLLIVALVAVDASPLQRS
jgi:hypothetical protein